MGDSVALPHKMMRGKLPIPREGSPEGQGNHAEMQQASSSLSRHLGFTMPFNCLMSTVQHSAFVVLLEQLPYWFSQGPCEAPSTMLGCSR